MVRYSFNASGNDDDYVLLLILWRGWTDHNAVALHTLLFFGMSHGRANDDRLIRSLRKVIVHGYGKLIGNLCIDRLALFGNKDGNGRPFVRYLRGFGNGFRILDGLGLNDGVMLGLNGLGFVDRLGRGMFGRAFKRNDPIQRIA